MISTLIRGSLLAFVSVAASAGSAAAQSPYDGRWNISVVTTRGACQSYNLPARIIDGHVTFPNLARAGGRVTRRGNVRVVVSANGGSASGAGRLSSYSGSGRWTGTQGQGRCVGYWTARRG